MTKTILPLAALGLLSAATLHASLIASDSFFVGTGGYNTTINSGRIYGINPTVSNTGFGVPWSNENNQVTGNLRASADALDHTLVSGATADGSLFAVANGTGRNATRALNGTAVTTITDLVTNSGSLYFGGLVGGPNWSPVAGSSAPMVQLGLGADRRHDELNTNGGVFARVGLDGAFGLSVTTASGTTTLTSVGNLAAGESHLFTTRIDFNHSVGFHRITLDLFNADALDPLSPSATGFFDVASADFTAAQLGYLVFNHNNTSTGTDAANPRFDEVRIGTSLSDVILIPEPSSLALLGISLASLLLFRQRT